MNTKVTRWSAIQRPDPNCHRRLNRDHIPPKSFSAPSVRSTHNLSMLLAPRCTSSEAPIVLALVRQKPPQRIDLLVASEFGRHHPTIKLGARLD
jgi:hypothetical protein